MCLKDLRDEFIYDCECRHLAKHLWLVAEMANQFHHEFMFGRVFSSSGCNFGDVVQDAEYHQTQTDECKYGTTTDIATFAFIVHHAVHHMLRKRSLKNKKSMACSRKLSSRDATGTLLKTGRRYLCSVYE